MPDIARTLRIAADRRIADRVTDVFSGRRPDYFRGNTLNFQFGFFVDGGLADLAEVTSITLQIKALVNGAAPSPDAAALMQKTVVAASINTSLTIEQWNSSTHQHATFSFTPGESNIAAGDRWIVVTAYDDSDNVVTWLAGILSVKQDGAGLITEPDEIANYLSLVVADARYVRAEYDVKAVDSDAYALILSDRGKVLVLENDAQLTGSMIVTEAGSGAANQTYLSDGTNDGKPMYTVSAGTSGEDSIKWVTSVSRWQLLRLNSVLYYSEDDVATPDLVTTWVESGGTLPLPTVTAETEIGDMAVTIPAESSVDFPVGSVANIVQKGQGELSVTGATGVSVNGTAAGSVIVTDRWQGVALLKVAADEWIISGAID